MPTMLRFAEHAVLALNATWFLAAFVYFSIRQHAAAKVLVPKPARESPLFLTIAASVRFLGGMNLAFAVLSVALLLQPLSSLAPDQRAVVLLVLAVAHGSQFYFNIPILRGGGRQGDALWEVKTGPMRFIFIVDGILMTGNAAVGVALLGSP